MCWSCPWPWPHRLVGFRADGPLPLHGLVFGPTLGQPERIWTGLPWDGTCPPNPCCSRLLVLFVAKWFSGQTPNRAFLSHPVTYVIAAGFLWMGLTVLPSSDVVVSLKAWVSRAWFIVSFYVLLAEWFRHDPRARRRFLALLLVPLSVVMWLHLVRHAGYDFSKGRPLGHEALLQRPHLVWRRSRPVAPSCNRHGIPHPTKHAVQGVVVPGRGMACLGHRLSFTRAAWVSLAAAAVCGC